MKEAAAMFKQKLIARPTQYPIYMVCLRHWSKVTYSICHSVKISFLPSKLPLEKIDLKIQKASTMKSHRTTSS